MSEHGIITGARILCRDPTASARDLKGALKGAINVHDEMRAEIQELREALSLTGKTLSRAVEEINKQLTS